MYCDGEMTLVNQVFQFSESKSTELFGPQLAAVPSFPTVNALPNLSHCKVMKQYAVIIRIRVCAIYDPQCDKELIGSETTKITPTFL